MFIDETCLNTKMVRLYGRSPRGTRCLGQCPHGHWGTSTFVAALRWDRLDAPLLVDGPMDGTIFLAYVEQVLAPCLNPGNIVVCDNLSCHKVDGVREVIEAQGAQIRYLPPYSPDLNPIEMAFSKLKTYMRKIAARDFDHLCAGVGSAVSQFTPSDCRNYFRHANYATI